MKTKHRGNFTISAKYSHSFIHMPMTTVVIYHLLRATLTCFNDYISVSPNRVHDVMGQHLKWPIRFQGCNMAPQAKVLHTFFITTEFDFVHCLPFYRTFQPDISSDMQAHTHVYTYGCLCTYISIYIHTKYINILSELLCGTH